MGNSVGIVRGRGRGGGRWKRVWGITGDAKEKYNNNDLLKKVRKLEEKMRACSFHGKHRQHCTVLREASEIPCFHRGETR